MNKQVGYRIPHIPSISNHTHNMLDMGKYNMASQQNSTAQCIYSLGSEGPDITNVGQMTQHTSHTVIQTSSGSILSEYRQLSKIKEVWKA